MSLKCYIIKDLFPNYIEKLTSKETNHDIEEHLAECSECQKDYQELTQSIPNIDLLEKKENLDQINYLKKCSTLMKKLFLILSVIITSIVIILAIFLFLAFCPESKKTTNINDYNKYFGKTGKYAKRDWISNDIFPHTLPKSATVENFYYYYYNPWDSNYLGYLVYTCDDKDYNKEIERLSKLKSSKNPLVYNTTKFNYPICAVYADSYHGYIYALADKKMNRLIYVELVFCNYFSDIDYEDIIPKKYLPVGFNAKHGNPTRINFEKSSTVSK